MRKQKEINYGILGDASRVVNCHLLHDCSGKTISRRTTLGFKKLLGINMSDQDAEHIIHAAMLSSTYLIYKNNNRRLGVFLLFLLALAYQKGDRP